MHVRVKWIDGVSFVGESETGHAVVMDGAPENGGRNIGMRPMEMLLIGMGGCTSFDVVAILKKHVSRFLIVWPKLKPNVQMRCPRYLPRFMYILWSPVTTSILLRWNVR